MKKYLKSDIFTDLKYILMAGQNLSRFKQAGKNTFNFRCPICGDSQKNKRKSRGYLFKSNKTDDFFYKCYNCDASFGFSHFLKKIDENLYNTYVSEILLSNKIDNKKHKDTKIEFVSEIPVFNNPKINLSKYFYSVLELPEEHVVLSYLNNRQIPEEHYKDIYYTPDFKKSTLSISKLYPDYEESKNTNNKLYAGEARIVFPFYYYDGSLIGYQGRSIVSDDNKTGLKYITIKLDRNKPKIYGLDRVDVSKTIIVVEGGIDSLFLDNALATTDSSLHRITSVLPEIDRDKFVMFFDQEPRNPQIVSNMLKTIELGLNVVIFSDSKIFPEKDINDAVIKGKLTTSIIHELINKNTLETKTISQKLYAKTILNRWKKINL